LDGNGGGIQISGNGVGIDKLAIEACVALRRFPTQATIKAHLIAIDVRPDFKGRPNVWVCYLVSSRSSNRHRIREYSISIIGGYVVFHRHARYLGRRGIVVVHKGFVIDELGDDGT